MEKLKREIFFRQIADIFFKAIQKKQYHQKIDLDEGQMCYVLLLLSITESSQSQLANNMKKWQDLCELIQ